MFILISFVLLAKCYADTCCDINNLLNDRFEIARYTGKWYEIVRSKDFPMENGECATATYSLNVKGNIDVLNSEILNGKLNTANAVGYRSDNSNMILLNFGFNATGNYIIVDTDYNNYSVVYSCSEYLTHKFEYVWILARQRNIDKELLSKLLILIKNKFNITENNLHITNQNEELCKLN